jgi:hypothetical protein
MTGRERRRDASLYTLSRAKWLKITPGHPPFDGSVYSTVHVFIDILNK